MTLRTFGEPKGCWKLSHKFYQVTHFLFRDLFYARCECEDEILGRTVIISGTTSGMGRALAEELSSRGMLLHSAVFGFPSFFTAYKLFRTQLFFTSLGGRIIMGCRNMEKCEEVRAEISKLTSNKQVFCKKLDLCSQKSIKEFAKDINESKCCCLFVLRI